MFNIQGEVLKLLISITTLKNKFFKKDPFYYFYRMKFYTYDNKHIGFKKSNKPYMFSFFGLLIGFIIGFFIFYDSPEIKYLPQEEKVVIIPKRIQEFSEENLYSYLKELEIKHPDIVLAQAKLETGNFTSDLFLESNNLFGMMRAQSRPNTSIGVTNNGFAIYKTWKDSVLDYTLYYTAYLKNKSRDEIFAFLQDKYAENPQYIHLLKNIIKNLNT